VYNIYFHTLNVHLFVLVSCLISQYMVMDHLKLCMWVGYYNPTCIIRNNAIICIIQEMLKILLII
jgi:hypothetical protein